MIITDVSACVFKHTTRRHSDTAGHAHPGPAHEVQQGILTIRTEDGHEGHSFAPPEVMRPHVLDKFVRKVLIGQDHRDRERLWQELAESFDDGTPQGAETAAQFERLCAAVGRIISVEHSALSARLHEEYRRDLLPTLLRTLLPILLPICLYSCPACTPACTSSL